MMFNQRFIFLNYFQEQISINQHKSLGKPAIYGNYFSPVCSKVLTVFDPELVKDVTVRHFDHFVNRSGPSISFFFGNPVTKYDKIWFKLLSVMNGQEWKRSR